MSQSPRGLRCMHCAHNDLRLFPGQNMEDRCSPTTLFREAARHGFRRTVGAQSRKPGINFGKDRTCLRRSVPQFRVSGSALQCIGLKQCKRVDTLFTRLRRAHRPEAAEQYLHPHPQYFHGAVRFHDALPVFGLRNRLAVEGKFNGTDMFERRKIAQRVRVMR